MKNVEAFLNGSFRFKSQETIFENKLDGLIDWTVYNNFAEFLADNPHYVVEACGKEMTPGSILDTADSFTDFSSSARFSKWYSVAYNQIGQPLIVAKAKAAGDSIVYVVSLQDIHSDGSLIRFLNAVLQDDANSECEIIA